MKVIVIGAGAVGAACAAALSRAGHRVTVLHLPARSTTALSGGHLLLQSKRPGSSLEMARRSLELLEKLAAGREAELRYARRGSLVLAATDAEVEALRAHHEALTRAGVPLAWLDAAEARELEPEIGPAVRAGTFCPLDAQVGPVPLASLWLSQAEADGAEVLAAPVERLLLDDGAVKGVRAGVDLQAEAVVLAAGPWSAELARSAGLDLRIEPYRGLLLRGTADRCLATRPLLGADYLCVKFGEAPGGVGFSFQQHPDGECVLGGTRERAGFSTVGAEAWAPAVLASAERYLPAATTVPWTRRDVGFRPRCADGPHAGPSGLPGLYLACGFEGDGITLAAAAAERIATCIGEGETCDNR
ncbi:MAG: NAD(P)/FAD-dependent oxidoreductase [Armatimonadota bacterium]